MPRAILSPPRDLTIPEPGSTTARDVLSAAMRRAVGDLMRLSASSPDRELASFKPTLKRLLAEAPGALVTVLRAPTVGGLLRCLRRRAPELEFPLGVAELLATIHTDLACLGALPQPVVQRRLPPRILSLPARRAIEVPQGCREARFDNGAIVLRLAGGGEREISLREPPSEPVLHPIAGNLLLPTLDNNPLAMSEAHPDKQGNALDLGGRPAGEWTSTLRRGLEIIGEHMPDLHGEIQLYLQLVVPVGYDEHKHLSASFQEIIGTVYMTLHPQLMTMVEAIIHEFQHNKLHALLELDPLLDNAFSPLYASPVRPDPRPLQGVLLAVHAFLPVARLYQLMREAGDPSTRHPDFQRRYAQIVEGNHEGATVLLDNGRPTEVGAGLLDEIRRWDRHDWGL